MPRVATDRTDGADRRLVPTPGRGPAPGNGLRLSPSSIRADAISAARSIVSSVQALGAGLAPWLDLLTRFWLAQAFLTGAAATLVMHQPPTMAGTGTTTALINALIASPFGFAVQTVCPILLFMGLFSRLASIPLLIQALAFQGPDGPSEIRLFWTVLLLWIVVFGPGPFSFDALFSHGIDSSAVPGAKELKAAYGWITRRLGPAYRVLVRLWIATAPLGGALVALSGSNFMRREQLAPWLASVPDTVATTSPAVSLTLASALIFGLGTRFAGLFLLATIPIAHVAHATDSRLYWMLLLAAVVLHGPGPFSLDGLLAKAFAAGRKIMAKADPALAHVVVVGGGFGGVAAARALKGAPCRVTLVDRRNYHLFQPLLYQVATAGLSPADIATPIRSMFRRQSNVAVLLAEVMGLDHGARELVLDRGRLRYDYLVLATGSQHSYFGKNEWARVAPGLKRIEDATDIRRRLLVGFERAESAPDPAERDAWLTFVVVGGGPTGVELAGAIAELALHGLQREFRSIDPADSRVILVQAGPRLLPTFPESLSADAEGALRRLGVEVRVSTKVDQVDERGVVIGGDRIAANTVLWAAGVAASPAGRWLEAETDNAGRVVVGPDLSVPGHRGVFAIGDTAASQGWNGKAVPGLAPAAKQGGSYVAKVIRSRLAGRAAPKPFGYRHAGSLATIGRQAAVAEFGAFRFHGALAWWIWGMAHILFLAGGRNRTTVVMEWVWAYFTYGRAIRLITEARSTT